MQGIGVVDLIRRDLGPFRDAPILHSIGTHPSQKVTHHLPLLTINFHRFLFIF